MHFSLHLDKWPESIRKLHRAADLSSTNRNHKLLKSYWDEELRVIYVSL